MSKKNEQVSVAIPYKQPSWQKFLLDKFYLLCLVSSAIVVLLVLIIVLISKQLEKKSFKVPDTWKDSIENMIKEIYQDHTSAEKFMNNKKYQEALAYVFSSKLKLITLQKLLKTNYDEIAEVKAIEKNIQLKWNTLLNMTSEIPENFIQTLKISLENQKIGRVFKPIKRQTDD